MARQKDDVTSRAKEAEMKSERKNYTYRLPIYLAELFAAACKQEDISPVTLMEQWIIQYVEPHEAKFGPKVLNGIDDIVDAKKENERKSRLKQKRKRGKSGTGY